MLEPWVYGESGEYLLGSVMKLGRTSFFVSLVVAHAGCAAPTQRQPDAEVVPCPLNEIANAILRNVVEECASSHGDWAHDMGPGCPRIWATQFGFTAGLRRGREDLIELAETTADRQSADLNRLILGAIFGSDASGGPEAYGTPALFVSGILNGSGGHYAKFRLAFDRGLEQLDFDSLPDTRLAGIAVLLAELARTEEEEREELLERARGIAAKISGARFRSFALAAIAKASGSAADLERAREGVEDATPEFRLEKGRLVFDVEEKYVLSHFLVLVHALADMAQLTGNSFDRTRAQELLAFVFSDHFFDGRVLVHDGSRDGFRSPRYCSGCNLSALYLVDRLYGDTFKVDPLPELPERSDDWLERKEEVHELFPLRSDQPGSYFADEFGVTVGYTEIPPNSQHPRGALRLSFRLGDSIQNCKFRRQGDKGVEVPLDENDRARYTLGADSVVEGTYDPEVSSYTFEIGPSGNGSRQIRILASRHKQGTD